MQFSPDRDTFNTLAKDYTLIPVCADFCADAETPVSAYTKLSGTGPAFLYESITGGEQIGRYSFVGARPYLAISCHDEKTTIRWRDGRSEEVETPTDPLELLRERMEAFRVAPVPDLPRFHGGAVGFVGYDYIHRVEPTVPVPERDELGMPLTYFMLTDTVVIFDHARQLMRVCANAHVEGDPEQAWEQAVAEIERVIERLRSAPMPAACSLESVPAIEPPAGNFTQEAFENVVDRCKDYIVDGDAIQIVASQRFEEPFEGTAVDLYRALRLVNPSPYMFILDTGDYAAVGASPEVHVRLTDGHVEARPIAGTRPRGKDAREDADYEADLLADEKERAEHLMLVDLARNDLGRVCQSGKVVVPEYMVVERYSHVMHIVSQVEGELAEGKDAYDVLRATFPAGTVSGAPKVRAMQIISEMEGTRRGIYAGALGYFGFDGNHDSCIGIRTALLKEGKLYIQSGAGLVADSVPVKEYEETLNKARAMFKAVALARTF